MAEQEVVCFVCFRPKPGCWQQQSFTADREKLNFGVLEENSFQFLQFFFMLIVLIDVKYTVESNRTELSIDFFFLIFGVYVKIWSAPFLLFQCDILRKKSLQYHNNWKVKYCLYKRFLSKYWNVKGDRPRIFTFNFYH